MSAPLKLTSEALADIADALTELTAVATTRNVEVGSCGSASITHTAEDGTETVLSITWDDERAAYIIDDRIGE